MAFSAPKRKEMCFEALYGTNGFRKYAKLNHVQKTPGFKENSKFKKNIFSNIYSANLKKKYFFSELFSKN